MNRCHRRYRRWRRVVLAERGGLCERCAARGLYVAAQDLHHLEPLAVGGPLMDRGNVAALCRSCHLAAHAPPRDDRGRFARKEDA